MLRVYPKLSIPWIFVTTDNLSTEEELLMYEETKVNSQDLNHLVLRDSLAFVAKIICSTTDFHN